MALADERMLAWKRWPDWNKVQEKMREEKKREEAAESGNGYQCLIGT